ncbi:hypothetical protein [Photorhabdus bodei]|uniref:Uncharacterized protein n=1 Tax=Photorhabdus bodei TaxID=2029681 RepID=A0AAW6BD12_9GAMM|nr:hypothetical protein [Photorhabdus bodei]MCC8466267.1 hypothetical protein [Photorhabdus bodei]MDB6371072.1 hypothetical protein [Photorhabdus bodei]
MSAKNWIYQSEQGDGLYQEITIDDTDNSVVIEMEQPFAFTVDYRTDDKGEFFSSIRVQIPA